MRPPNPHTPVISRRCHKVSDSLRSRTRTCRIYVMPSPPLSLLTTRAQIFTAARKNRVSQRRRHARPRARCAVALLPAATRRSAGGRRRCTGDTRLALPPSHPSLSERCLPTKRALAWTHVCGVLVTHGESVLPTLGQHRLRSFFPPIFLRPNVVAHATDPQAPRHTPATTGT